MLNKNILFAILFSFLIAGAVAVRLYHFDYPVLDWHSWRQADTSAVSRNFVNYGFDILHPKFDDLSKNVSLLDNPKGYRFVEFPIYNILQAGLFIFFPKFTIEEWGRLISIISSIGAIVFLYLFVSKYVSRQAAFWAAFLYAFAPYSVYFGRTILPDQMMVMLMLGGIYFFDAWLGVKPFFNYKFLLAIIFTALAVLIKPFVLFFGFIFLYLAWKKFGIALFKRWELWIFGIIAVLPFILWRLWMLQYPEGIPQSNWLFNGNGVRFTGAFLRWIFADRIASLILGFFGLPFFIIGIIGKIKKEGLLFIAFLASSLMYINVIATGNTQHDYYQLLILPMIAIFFGKGINLVLTKHKEVFNRFIAVLTIFVCVFFMLALSWYRIRDFYTLQHYEVLGVGKIIDSVIPKGKDIKIIAPFGGDTTFLYYTNRQGWPVVDRPFYQFVDAGADYIVFVNPSKSDLGLQELFTPVQIGANYAIFDLTKPTDKGKESMKIERKKDKGKK
ncbi:MAG: glycosyltransferase family 39 protein [Candidatus Levyibacteriota bacterium]|nr:MAG: glycosyltransferase family 39 protein [Candidatus Levybacteria bacterium]